MPGAQEAEPGPAAISGALRWLASRRSSFVEPVKGFPGFIRGKLQTVSPECGRRSPGGHRVPVTACLTQR
ncbi:hypothetical protein DUI87_04622 [Hirundo rustica rustica]|uniref:Uncharacterized protein n=1 Tax=Hirundo rustica rustica TaxID=333673 RepID=A0A3M0L0X9_HIRRU|nr:hypothetical protein DUI87_04622 [Hirundo rustica rustica]